MDYLLRYNYVQAIRSFTRSSPYLFLGRLKERRQCKAEH